MVKWILTFLLGCSILLSTGCGRQSPLEKYQLMREQQQAEIEKMYRNNDYSYSVPEEETYEEDQYAPRPSTDIYEREQELIEYERNRNNRMLFDR